MSHTIRQQLPKTLLTLLCSSLIACSPRSSTDPDDNDGSNYRLGLNDTGTTLYSQSFPTRALDAPSPEIMGNTPDSTAPGQDADHGSDKDASDNDGKAGFKFTHLDSDGIAFTTPPSNYATTPWSCVKDETTGLIWEVKTLSGLQMYNASYTWYNPDETTNGGHAGAQNDSGSCFQSLTHCNTQAYIDAINGLALCGLNNWRLPLREELRSIIDYSVTVGAMVDKAFFPNAIDDDTWTAQSAYYNTDTGTEAWEVHFDSGYSEAHDKNSPSVYVRLVHDPIQ